MALVLQIAILAALALLACRLEGIRGRIDALDLRLREHPGPPKRDGSTGGAVAEPRRRSSEGPRPGRRAVDWLVGPIVTFGPDEAAPAADPAVVRKRSGPAPAAVSRVPRPAAEARPPLPRLDIEFGFGRRWAALLGGALVAFGLALLLRHSLEQGYVPPSLRLCGAALLSLVLCASAEVFRRRGTFVPAAGAVAAGLARRAADIPSILLGTGLGGLFASSYAAHAVYGTLGATPAFAVMAVAALAGVAASLAYGPALGALGYLAAQGVPLLVGGAEGAPVAAYVSLVGVAGYAASHAGGWRRLENPAGAVLLLWAALLGGESRLVAAAASGAAFAVTALRLRPRAAWTDWRPDRAAWAALLLMAGQGFLLATRPTGLTWSSEDAAGQALGFAVLLVAFGFAATATRVRAAAPALAAAVAGAVAISTSRVAEHPEFVAADLLGCGPIEVAAILAMVSAVALAAASAALKRGSRRSPLTGLAGAGSAAAMLASSDLALRLAGGMDGRILAGFAAAQGAALLATARPRAGAIPPARQFATAAAGSAGVALLGFALVASGVGGGPLTTLVVALAGAGAALLAVAWTSSLFASVAGIAAAAVLAGAAVGIAGHGGEGTTLWPFVANTLLPGLVLAAATALLRLRVGTAAVREADRCWLDLIGARAPAPQAGQAISLTLAGTAAGGLLLTAAVGVVRFLAYGAPCAPLSAPADIGLACTLALTGSLAASRLHRAVPLAILLPAARGLALAALPLAAAALLASPFDTGTPVGALPVLNLLVLAYLLPAVAAWRLAREFSRPDRTAAEVPRIAAAAVAILGLLAYATLSVAQAFQGPVLSIGRFTEAELWCYTATWLIMAAGVMAYGLRFGARLMRLAALAILAGTGAKVVLVDFADLTGVARAASVLALGLVLLGVGMVYQRLSAAGQRP